MHCAFTDNFATTTVLHDHGDEDISVTHCKESGCFVQEYKYEAPIEQIVALMELSEECSQNIRYRSEKKILTYFIFHLRCLLSPFENHEARLGWWKDRHGEDQIYWDGANYGNHVCQCDSVKYIISF